MFMFQVVFTKKVLRYIQAMFWLGRESFPSVLLNHVLTNNSDQVSFFSQCSFTKCLLHALRTVSRWNRIGSLWPSSFSLYI